MKLIKRSVCMEIKGITNLVHQELNNAKGRPPHPGTMMQKLFLGYLDAHRDRDVYQKDLEATFHIRRSTASGILQIMVRDGLLVREPVEGDARLKCLVLTPIAQEQLSQMQQDLLRVENKATAALTKQELETLFTLLDKVRGSLAPGKEEPFID